MPCLCLRDPSNNRSPNTLFFETTGWAGSVCILTAYLHKWEELLPDLQTLFISFTLSNPISGQPP